MDSRTTVVVLLVGVLVGLIMYKATKSPISVSTLGRGKEDREEQTLRELTILNDFKRDVKGTIEVSMYRKQLMKHVRQFERNRGVRIIRSTLFAEGPILLNEF